MVIASSIQMNCQEVKTLKLIKQTITRIERADNNNSVITSGMNHAYPLALLAAALDQAGDDQAGDWGGEVRQGGVERVADSAQVAH